MSCKVAVWGRASPSEHRRRHPPPRGSRHPPPSVRLSHLPATRHPHGAIVPLATTASHTPLCPPGTIPRPARARQALPQGRRQPPRFSYSLGVFTLHLHTKPPKRSPQVAKPAPAGTPQALSAWPSSGSIPLPLEPQGCGGRDGSCSLHQAASPLPEKCNGTGWGGICAGGN